VSEGRGVLLSKVRTTSKSHSIYAAEISAVAQRQAIVMTFHRRKVNFIRHSFDIVIL